MYEIHELARKHIKYIYFDFNEILLDIVHGKIFATNFFFYQQSICLAFLMYWITGLLYRY